MFLGSLYALAVLLCLLWWNGIVKNRRELSKVALMKHEAEIFLQRAVHLSTLAGIEQPFAVCEECQQIRSRYVRDENGVTCIECAEKHTERE